MDRALTPVGGDNSEAGKAILRQIPQARRQQVEATRHAQKEPRK